MKKEHLTKVGIYFGVLMFTLVNGLVGWGADSLPPRTVLLAENTAVPTIPDVSVEGAVEAPEASEASMEQQVAQGCATCDYGDEMICVAPTYSRVKWGGWIESGIIANSRGATSDFDADGFVPTSGNSDRLGSKNRSTGWQMQQAWLFAQRELENNGCGFDWGFRADFMFGTEAFDFQSWGDGSFDGKWNAGSEYNLAIPQLYVELGFNQWSLKLGKFGSPMGYESIMSPEHVLYTHSYLYNHEPGTFTGGLLTYEANDCLSVYFGLTTGADTGFGNEYGDIGFLMGFEATLTDKISVSYGFMWNEVHSGNVNNLREASPVMADIWSVYPAWAVGTDVKANETFHSFVLEWQLTERFKYAFQTNYGAVRGVGQSRYEQIGIANYFEYQLTCNLAMCFRAEWFRQNAIGLDHQNYYGYTLGFSYTPCDWLIIRPEIRYDICHGAENARFNYGNNHDQFSGGVGVIVKF